MPLEEQLSDMRSNQVALRLRVENAGDSPVSLLRLDPRVPDRVRLVEVKDRSMSAATAKRLELIEQLNKLLRQQLWVESEAFRALWIERQRESLEKVLTVSGYFRLMARVMFTNRRYQEDMKREFETNAYIIDSLEDARSAQGRWMSEATKPSSTAELYRAKMEQLERVDGLVRESEKKTFTVIEPGSEYAATYVVECPRHAIEPRKYQVSVEAVYQLGDTSAATQATGATATVLISPYPAALSAVAVLGALLGGAVQASLNNPTVSLIDAVWASIYSGRVVVGPIIALVFFNVYEYTAVGKNLAMSLSWRSGLLVGTLCGLAQDRVLAALKAFLAGSA